MAPALERHHPGTQLLEAFAIFEAPQQGLLGIDAPQLLFQRLLQALGLKRVPLVQQLAEAMARWVHHDVLARTVVALACSAAEGLLVDAHRGRHVREDNMQTAIFFQLWRRADIGASAGQVGGHDDIARCHRLERQRLEGCHVLERPRHDFPQLRMDQVDVSHAIADHEHGTAAAVLRRVHNHVPDARADPAQPKLTRCAHCCAPARLDMQALGLESWQLEEVDPKGTLQGRLLCRRAQRASHAEHLVPISPEVRHVGNIHRLQTLWRQTPAVP
mmetsp:Transcript_131867/g.381374  ORF Transcript_131867/g.381374 Transcript_131867/m.381374 type:complete len:274 (-) Transcript_131867:2379-3200(-)